MDSDSEAESMDQAMNEGTSPLSLLKFDPSYVVETWPGRLKVAQFFAVLLCGCLLPSSATYFFSRYAFFTFVIWTSFIYITIHLALHLSSLAKLLPDAVKAPGIIIFPVLIAALLFLLCSSLIAGVADISGAATLSWLSALLGLLTMALFIAEGVLYFLDIRASQQSNEEVPTSPTSGRMVPQNPDVAGNTLPTAPGGIIIGMPAVRTGDPVDPPAYDDVYLDDEASMRKRRPESPVASSMDSLADSRLDSQAASTISGSGPLPSGFV